MRLFIYLRSHIHIRHAYLLIMSRVIVFIVLPMANYKEKDTSNQIAYVDAEIIIHIALTRNEYRSNL